MLEIKLVCSKILFFLVLLHKSESQLPPLDKDLLAWVTPTKGNISLECEDASNQLINNLLSWNGALESGIPDLLYMVDSDGRVPMEGFLSDTQDVSINLCTLLEQNNYSCDLLPAVIPHEITLMIPMGYSNNPGSQEECYTKELETKTQYCTIRLKGPNIDFGGREIGNLRSLVEDVTIENIAMLGHISRQYKKSHTNSEPSNSTIKIKLFDSKMINSYLTSYNLDQTLTDDLTEMIVIEGMAIYSSIAKPEIGMCYPKQCSLHDISENYNQLTSKTDLKVSASACYNVDNPQGTPDVPPFWFFLFYTIYIIIVILLIIGTCLDLVQIFVTKTKSTSFLTKMFQSFSLYTNGKNLLSTESTSKDHLDCMNGMRFFSMTWVVLGHSFFITFFGANRNSGVLTKIFDGQIPLALEVIVNAYPSVDTFFVMSGALTTYIFLRGMFKLTRAGNDVVKHTISFILYYVHRYLRITIPYFLVMGIIISILPYVYYGPGWDTIIRESQGCRTWWWAHLLYIHTLIDKEKYDVEEGGSCMAVSWYLVDDMMFHIFSPIVIYPLYFLSKNGKHVWSTLYWILTLAISTFVVFYISFTSKLPPIKNMNFPDLETDYTYRVEMYYAPWGRYQAYLIGIFLGYVLHHLRGKSVKIPWFVNIISWIISFLAAFTVVYGIHNSRQTHKISLLNATLYNTFQRIMWNGAMSWVIFSCSKGHGGIIGEFLSWSGFAPLSRLTFCAYLIHINIVIMFGSSVLSSFPNDFEYFSTTWYFLAILFISLVLASMLTLIFEIPFTKAEKILVESIIKALINKPGNNGMREAFPQTKPQPVEIIKVGKTEKNSIDKGSKLSSHCSEESKESKPPAYDIVMKETIITNEASVIKNTDLP